MTDAAPLTFPPEAPADRPLLAVDDLRVAFRTRRGLVRAVDGVSLSVRRGQTLGIVGESGSGKTVLIRSVMGLLPTRQVERSGRICLEDTDLATLTERRLRHYRGTEMAMVFQDPMTALNPVVRIGRQLTEGLRRRAGLDRAAARQTAVALLGAVGIADAEARMRAYPHELSGGTRQRVTVAIALACGPKILLADEPTTGLDVTVQMQVLDLLGDQQAQRQMAMVLVTHDLGLVATRADQICVMYAGRVVEQAPAAVLFAHTRMPYTEALLGSTPHVGQRPHSRLAAIPGRPPDLARLGPGCRFAPRCPYAQQRCRAEEPHLRTAGPDHWFACWYPVGSAEADDALARNAAAGLPAAVALAGVKATVVAADPTGGGAP